MQETVSVGDGVGGVVTVVDVLAEYFERMGAFAEGAALPLHLR